MSDPEAKSGLRSGQRNYGTPGSSSAPRQSDQEPIYYDTQQSPTARLLQRAFTVVVVLMVLISFILSIIRSATLHQGLYVLLGLGLVGFLAINIILVLFVRNGDLSPEKSWFLYFVGGCIVIESILTNILLFQKF